MFILGYLAGSGEGKSERNGISRGTFITGREEMKPVEGSPEKSANEIATYSLDEDKQRP
jgi:hypothetical protein